MEAKNIKYYIKWDEWEGQPVVDINFKNYDMVIEFMWENSFMRNIVYEGLGLQEDEDMKTIYSEYARHILRNECSVMMLSEDETEIIAVGLLERMTEEWHSWIYLPTVIPKGIFNMIIMMKKELVEKVKSENQLDTLDSLTVHEIAIPGWLYDNDEFVTCFFDVFGMVAQHMHMPRVFYIALSNVEQNTAALAEYEDVGRSIYSIYKVNNNRPFDILRELDEMYALIFELTVEPIVYYEEWPGFEVFHEELRLKQHKEEVEKEG